MTSKTKLLFIHDYPLSEGGGVETQTYTDALWLSRRGYDVKLATTRTSSETYVEDSPLGYPRRIHDGFSLEFIDSWPTLHNLLAWADLVNVHATFSLRPGVMAALKLLSRGKRPFVVTLATTINHLPFSRLATVDPLTRQEQLEAFADYLRADHCVVLGVSQVLQESLDALQVAKKIQVIHNAKDWANFANNVESALPQVDLTYVGEVSWMKGLHLLVGILLPLKQDIPSFTARIIGDGQYMSDAKAIISSLCLDRNVALTGYVENGRVAQYLAATRVLVVPSLTESWCNVAMEALGLGVLLVASRTEGLIELTENGALGLLFERGNPCDLYRQLTLALSDSDTRARYTDLRIAQKIRSTYGIEDRINSLDACYQEILSNHS